MSDLLSIGRFAAMTGLTQKALRLYDREGILKPAYVDFASGYRYYDPGQSDKARRILLLRSLHFRLDEIAVLLTTEDVTVVQERLDRQCHRLREQIAVYERALETFPSGEEWCQIISRRDTMTEETKTHECSFCSKSNDEVARMIAGPKGAVICNECVALCVGLIDREEEAETRA